MTPPDPKDLINIPGAGRAETALRATGAWDDSQHPDALDWTVLCYGTVDVAGQIAVRAADAITAERLARQKVADGLVHFDRTEAVELTGLVVLDGAGGAAR